ncbi:MAG: cytochrome c-type biogenesis protein CcmH [Alphaproteobacteria bacterium]|nr:cytochrome c-type biogenesis protein CcmH [Alphaproteobacteria bacterium]
MRYLIASLLLVAAQPICARDYADESLPDPRQEAQAVALMDTLRCVVCQGQPISGSNADLARDMRRLVRERIERGDRPEAVRAWLVSRYGQWISLKPEMNEMTAPLWAVPLLALLGAAMLYVRRAKRKAR